jgi:hypothetical protein
MNVLFIGDVMGRPGRRAVVRFLPDLRRELQVDVVLANGENLAAGAGLTHDTAGEMFAAGVDLLTSGNHLFDKREGHGYIEREDRLVRPANYPPGTPGAVIAVVDAPGGKLAVGCVLGRVFMKPFDDPFRAVDALVETARSRDARYMIVDVHAEASSEKMALGWYLDGRVSAVLGTHTHIPTADERVLPGGTAYISDVGMTGPYDSVIGMEKNAVIAHFVTGLHHKFQPATRDIRFYAVLIDMDEATGRARSIRRIALELAEGESA